MSEEPQRLILEAKVGKNKSKIIFQYYSEFKANGIVSIQVIEADESLQEIDLPIHSLIEFVDYFHKQSEKKNE